MKKKYFLFIYFFVSLFSFSQKDSLILKNGLISVVKITRLEKKEVFFLIPGDESNTVHAVNRADLKRICLHSNIVEVVDSAKLMEAKKQAIADSIANKFTRNFVGINLSQLIASNVTVTFQHVSKEGNVAWKVQASANISPKKINFETQYGDGYLDGGWPNYLTQHLKFHLNYEMNYFPMKQKKISWYIGHGVQFGVMDYSFTGNTQYLALPTFVPTIIQGANARNIAAYAQAGVLGRITEQVYVEMCLAGGIQRTTFSDAIPRIDPFGSFQFAVGYSFNYKKKKPLTPSSANP